MQSEFTAYAAVFVDETGCTNIVGTCIVRGGAAALAVACGKPNARVVGLDAETANRIAEAVFHGMTEIPNDTDVRELTEALQT